MRCEKRLENKSVVATRYARRVFEGLLASMRVFLCSRVNRRQRIWRHTSNVRQKKEMYFHGKNWPSVATYDGDQEKWTAIEYSEYWDFARAFVCSRNGRRFFFEAPFLSLDDEYSDYFMIREIPNHITIEELKERSSLPSVGQILPVSEVTMDETRKKFILTKCLDEFEYGEQAVDLNA